MSKKQLGYILKANWAAQHLQQLDQAVVNWFKNKTYSHALIPNQDEPGTYILEVKADEIPIAPLSLIVGDIVQNIRSSLDHLVFELCVNNNDSLFLTNKHRSQFPIIGNENNSGTPINGADYFKRHVVNDTIKFVTPAAQALIESVQPFKSGDKFAEHALWILNCLSNIDKHRVLHIGAAYAGSYNVFRCRVEGDFSATPKLIKNGVTRVKLGKVSPLNPNDKLEDLIHPKMTICFNEGPFEMRPIVGILANIYKYAVEQVLNPLMRLIN